MVCGRFIKVFYKTTTCPKRPLLSGSSYTGLTVFSNPNPKAIFGTKKKLEQLELCETEYCQGLLILSNFEWINTQPNLHKKTTLGTIRKWSSWVCACLIKHLYKKWPRTKSGHSWQVFSVYSHCKCFTNKKDLLE